MGCRMCKKAFILVSSQMTLGTVNKVQSRYNKMNGPQRTACLAKASYGYRLRFY